MKIVEATLADMKNTPRGRRRRSPQTQLLIDTISAMKSGEVKALIPEGKETIKQLRPRISYAARVAGRKVRIAAGEDRVMFTLRTGARSGASSRTGAAARKARIQAKAIELGKRRKTDISAQDVIDALEAQGESLGTDRPGTAVGAVLRSMPEFERTGSNKFKYNG